MTQDNECNKKNDKPNWYLDLFDHVDFIDKNNIWVHNEKEGKLNWRQKSKYVLERKLFLIFCASSSSLKIKKENWRVYKITLKDFSKVTWVEVNSLTRRKSEKWFIDNRITLMKYIFSKKTPDVIKNLFEGATEKDDSWKVQTTAIKLFLEYIEWFKQSVELSWVDWKNLMPSIIQIIKPNDNDNIIPKEDE